MLLTKIILSALSRFAGKSAKISWSWGNDSTVWPKLNHLSRHIQLDIDINWLLSYKKNTQGLIIVLNQFPSII